MVLMILGAIAAIFMVVVIHEYGHFIVARCCGVKVVKFSVGFGRAIYSYTSKKTGTEYALSWIPLGGYVKMYGEPNEDPLPDDPLKNQAYSTKPVWQRMAISFAGPFANFVLAIILFFVVYLMGIVYVKPIIGHVVPNSIAAKAGLQRGEQIIKIDHQPVYGWQQVVTNLLAHIGDKQPVQVVTQKNNIEQVHALNLSNWTITKRSPDILHELGFVRHYIPIPPVIEKVMTNSPAARAGLKPHDLIVSVNGTRVKHWLQLLHDVRKHPGKTIQITVLRNQKVVPLTLTIGRMHESGKLYGHIGAEVKLPPIPARYVHTVRYGFWGSIKASAYRTWNMFFLNLKIVGKMFSGTVSLNTLSGPITVFKVAGQASQAGLSVYLSFIAFVSVALGFLNLLPIPMLDGGHILFQCIEAIARRPVPLRYQIMGLKVGVIVIVWLMLQATINDILRIM